MKTIIHEYYFNTHNANEKTAYEALRTKLKSQGLECFETWGNGSHYHGKKLDGQTIELETSSLFDNQWNTAPIEGFSENGLRVFDWAQDYPVNLEKNIKRGHYLEQTEEMKEIRRNTMKCGYCGKQEPAAKGLVFCPHCLDSEYLTQKEVENGLTRMRSIDHKEKLKPLSKAEKENILPLFQAAQIRGSTERGKARIAKERADLEKEFQETTQNAKTKRDGFLWLMNHGINTDNVIFYSHTNTFSFGWRHPVEDFVRDAILDVISEFPFAYEIKCANGKTLS